MSKKKKENTKFVYELNDKQEKKFRKWKKAIKKVSGEYGTFTYKFTPTGIGDGVSVFSHITQTEIDLTDVEEW